MLWDMHLCVFDVRLSFENRVVAVRFCRSSFRRNFFPVYHVERKLFIGGLI